MTNDSESDSFFNNDLAITKGAEDHLERATIAGKLADDIQGYFNSTDDKHKEHREASFVIAILGKWGKVKPPLLILSETN